MAEITKKRVGELLRGVFEILLEHQDGLPANEVLERLEKIAKKEGEHAAKDNIDQAIKAEAEDPGLVLRMAKAFALAAETAPEGPALAERLLVLSMDGLRPRRGRGANAD